MMRSKQVWRDEEGDEEEDEEGDEEEDEGGDEEGDEEGDGSRDALPSGLLESHTHPAQADTLKRPLFLSGLLFDPPPPPPVGSLTSCCPVLWEITSLSSWHSWQTVFWLAYAQLLLSSFPGFSPPITARLRMCYFTFESTKYWNRTFPIS